MPAGGPLPHPARDPLTPCHSRCGYGAQQSHLAPPAFSPGPCSLFYQEAGISMPSWTCASTESEHKLSSLLIEHPKPLGLEGQFSHLQRSTPPPHKPGCLCFLSLGCGYNTVPIQKTRKAHSPNPIFAHLSTFNPEESQKAGLVGVTYSAKFGWVCTTLAPRARPGHYVLAQ